MNSFIVDGDFRWTCSGVEGGSSISSLGHQDYGSMRYELGYMGHLGVVSAISWRSSTERRKKTDGRTTQCCSTDCLVIPFIYVRVYYWTGSGIEGASLQVHH